MILDSLGGHILITCILKSGRERQKSDLEMLHEKDLPTASTVASFEDAGMEHEPRNVGVF